MNIAQLNFVSREKVSREVILPHPPTYVIEGKEKNAQVWYFTSEKWITLKKKRDNTCFSAFIRSSNQRNQFPQQAQPNSQQSNKTPFTLPPIPSLLFLIKQNKTYLQSKLRHIINSHSSENYQQSLSCPTCRQIELTDYDFLLIESEKFINLLKEVEIKDETVSLDTVIDRLMERSLLGRKDCGKQWEKIIEGVIDQPSSLNYQKQNIIKLPKSTFNPYIPHILSHQGFKYSIFRLQSLIQKHHFMTTNTNRINYRKQLNLQSTNNQIAIESQKTIKDMDTYGKNNIKQECSSILAQKISSVLWTQQFLLFDVEKESGKKPNQEKVINQHMKQKLSEKCESVRAYLEKEFRKLFVETYDKKQKNIRLENYGKVDIKIKQFRLWYLNNNMRNNHCYTILTSEVKVEFFVSDQRWVAEFWTRVQLNLQDKTTEKREKIKQQTSNPVHNTIRTTSRNRAISSKETVNRALLRSKNQVSKYKNTIQNPLQQPKPYKKQEQTISSKQSCSCCYLTTQQGSKVWDYVKNTSGEEENQFEIRRLIIERHIQRLRQRVKQVLGEKVESIQKELIYVCRNKQPLQQRTQGEVKKQNSLIVALGMLKETISRIPNSFDAMSDAKEGGSKILESRNSQTDRNNFMMDSYDEVVVCEACYQVFLIMVKSDGDKQKSKNSIFATSTIFNYTRPNSSKPTSKITIKQRITSFQHHIYYDKKPSPNINPLKNPSNKSNITSQRPIKPTPLPPKHRMQSFSTHKDQSFSTGTIIPESHLNNPIIMKTRPSSHQYSVAKYNRAATKQQDRTQGDTEWSKTEFSQFEQHKLIDRKNTISGPNVRIDQQLISLPPPASYMKPKLHHQPQIKNQQKHTRQLLSSKYILVQKSSQQSEDQKPKAKKTRLQKFEERIAQIQCQK